MQAFRVAPTCRSSTPEMTKPPGETRKHVRFFPLLDEEKAPQGRGSLGRKIAMAGSACLRIKNVSQQRGVDVLGESHGKYSYQNYKLDNRAEP